MKRFSIPTLIILVTTLIVSACGTQASPTINVNDLQNTAVAQAFTQVAETQAALPTATPLPPTAVVTDTLAVTLPPVPTAGEVNTATPGVEYVTETAVVDPCINTVLPGTLTGIPIKIRVDNPTKAAITLTVYLQQNQPNDVCGYRAYTLAAGGSLVITDLVEGCYSLWAWNPDPKGYFMVTNGTSCLNSSQNWTFDISPNGIKLR